MDAKARGIKQNDLLKIYNDRGAVICSADVSSMLPSGVVKSYQSSAKYEIIHVAGEDVEIGGCLNILTPDRAQTSGTHSMSPNSTLVEIEKYQHASSLCSELLKKRPQKKGDLEIL